jgi:hypothetical protein
MNTRNRDATFIIAVDIAANMIRPFGLIAGFYVVQQRASGAGGLDDSQPSRATELSEPETPDGLKDSPVIWTQTHIAPQYDRD